eukprot:m.54521 g.54521  ORF g.54521 m.54521 type:complete len:501 (+) comp13628_c0_seq1:121-1623(+)
MRATRRAACSALRLAEWQTVVGLEIHAQILARTKIFSGGATTFHQPPNANVVSHDLSLPGTLPVLNHRCVEAGLLTATALQATVNHQSTFDRKHYFYYDMPAGYQITQQGQPLAEGGRLRAGYKRDDPWIRIQRLQLEQDSAKSLHTAAGATLVDFNRAGMGLMEIVTEPDLTSGAQAASFVRQLVALLKTLGVSDGKLAEGSLRVDANVSLKHSESDATTPRCEVKNVNGLRFLAKAIEYEAQRHRDALAQDQPLTMETRYYDVPSNTTIPMRSKEDDLDYRFMPEPNLPPLVVEAVWLQALVDRMPELPQARVQRLEDSYGLKPADAIALEEEPGAALYFENMAAARPDDQNWARRCAHWLLGPVFAQLRVRNLEVGTLCIPSSVMAELVGLVQEEQITIPNAQQVLELLLDGAGGTVDEIAQEHDLLQGTMMTEDVLRQKIAEIVQSHPKQLAKYQQGQRGVHGFFVGQAMQQFGQESSAKQLSKLITAVLESDHAI